MSAAQAFGQAAGATPGIGPSASMPALGDPLSNYSPGLLNQLKGCITNMVGGPDNMAKIDSVMGKVSKAQRAYKLGSGLLGGQPQMASAPPPPANAFGSKASPVNLSQFTAQRNSMMPQQLPPQLAMLPPNDPRVLAYLQQMGGMYG